MRVVGGWTGAQFAEKRLPAISELNAAAPDTPVLVTVHAATVRLAVSVGLVAAVLPGTARPVLADGGKVKISVSDFNRAFSAMKKLRPVTRTGHGKIAVLLPDTISLVRYVCARLAGSS